jgi:hypothetical protein
MTRHRRTPHTLDELRQILGALQPGRAACITVLPPSNNVEIDLGAVTIPIQRARLADAKALLARLSTRGHPPSDTDVKALFDMIDLQGQ